MHIFLSGLFLFLFGLEGGKWSIKKASSERLRILMISLDNNVIIALVTGVIITAVMQSSSALSVILIGFIEARFLKLKTAICILLGANIGTTFTVQLISLPILRYYPYLILIGLIIITIGMFINSKLIYTGFSFVFFAVVFAGLVIMTDFFKSESMRQTILSILKYSDTSIYYGILIGGFTTAIVQSSSAVTGITVSLGINNLITIKSAIAIALGSNVGTCITAFLASINAGRVSRAMARGHFVFNLIGVLAVLPIFPVFIYIVVNTSDILVRQIANAHTIFNIFNVIIFLPFLNTFISLIGGDDDGNI
ncbi:MAG: Na/Pi cotransporter family protein [Halanaerobiales bacterium]